MSKQVGLFLICLVNHLYPVILLSYQEPIRGVVIEACTKMSRIPITRKVVAMQIRKLCADFQQYLLINQRETLLTETHWSSRLLRLIPNWLLAASPESIEFMLPANPTMKNSANSALDYFISGSSRLTISYIIIIIFNKGIHSPKGVF